MGKYDLGWADLNNTAEKAIIVPRFYFSIVVFQVVSFVFLLILIAFMFRYAHFVDLNLTN